MALLDAFEKGLLTFNGDFLDMLLATGMVNVVNSIKANK